MLSAVIMMLVWPVSSGEHWELAPMLLAAQLSALALLRINTYKRNGSREKTLLDSETVNQLPVSMGNANKEIVIREV